MKKTLAVLIVALLSIGAFAAINLGTSLVIHATDVGDGKVTLPGASFKAAIPINDDVGLSLDAQVVLLGLDDKAGLLSLDFYINIISDPDLVSIKLLVPMGFLFDTVDGSPDTAFGDIHVAAGLGLELSAPLSEKLALTGTLKAFRVQSYPANNFVSGIFEYFTGGLGVVWSF
ncbi:hypothetical protein AT15_01685 [Kosmotoga arenicorallina S304]|uniref:Outer membrane protein beta-barrel domain-containing protein n=1 Tax=Kosmotoga arenicorallina S304 TaxID=1453497 RepID=A0A176K029_9BACT|nr:hypothetical protein [Kosmotoga arenicorallina]OAA29772.1 hypothetical protein AT15_01685 [Kosmotoga arenicorallina S304]